MTGDISRCEFGIKVDGCISKQTEETETMTRRMAAVKPYKDMTVVCNECHRYFQRIWRCKLT